jgi:hypothetical protein
MSCDGMNIDELNSDCKVVAQWFLHSNLEVGDSSR